MPQKEPLRDTILSSLLYDEVVHLIFVRHFRSSIQEQTPTHTLSHQAAVKPLAWCPWKAHLLATGGGSTDRTIRLWNTLHGREAREPIDTGSQVSGLVWNSEYKELCSSHGYEEHQLTLWKYPSMQMIIDLKSESSVLTLET